ncbi:MAG: hypothetical protein CL917_06905 [Deltaproteobacteria bacterium]|nr:hypothetical protein [Deltaproteobacteria bacterium]
MQPEPIQAQSDTDKVPFLASSSQGDLSSSPLPRLILRLYGLRFSGELTLLQHSIRKSFIFKNGAPVQSESNLAGDSMTAFLSRSSPLNATEQLKIRQQKERTGGHEGLALIELGLIEPASLFELLQKQTQSALWECFGWASGSYVLNKKVHTDERLAPFQSDPMRLVQEGLSRYWNVERLLQELQENFYLYPVIHPHLGKMVKRVSLPLDCQPRLWNPRLNFSQNLADTELSPSTLSALWVLKECGGFRFLDSHANETTQPEARVLPQVKIESKKKQASSLKVIPDTKNGGNAPLSNFRTELTARKSAAESKDYYGLLGCSPKANNRELRKAYLAAAKKFHPDTLGRRGLATLRDETADLFARLTDAFELLSDPARRQAYDEGHTEEKDNLEANRVAGAELLYQKAKVLLRMGNFREAIAYLQEAIGLFPEESTFHSDLGWALYKKTPSEPEAAREALDCAIEIMPQDPLSHSRQAVVCRALGDTCRSEEALLRAQEIETASTRT